MWLINDTRDFEESKQLFYNAQPIGTYESYVLKKHTTDLSLYYGLYDGETLIAYYWLMAINNHPNVYKGHEFHVADEYQHKGIGTFFYQYILFHDKYIVISDHFHTKYSSQMWDKLRTIPEMEVGIYDEVADTFDWLSEINKTKIYGNDHIHFVVRAK